MMALDADFDPYTYPGCQHVDRLHGFVAAVSGLLVFTIAGRVAQAIPAPACYHGDPWRRTNTMISWLHAVIVGLGTSYCFFFKPEMLVDTVLYCDTFIYVLCAFSYGYFIYDFLDFVGNRKVATNFGVTLHHFLLLYLYGYALYYRLMLPQMTISLLTEFNSIFLHARKIMQFHGWPFTHPAYRLVTVINLITFILCRIVVITWSLYLFYTQATLQGTLTPVYQVTYYLSVLALIIIHYVLLRSLVNSDVLGKTKIRDKPGLSNGKVD